METIHNLIGGRLVPAQAGDFFEDLNPADHSDIVGRFPKSGATEVEMAVAAARKAFQVWSELPPPKRGEIIYRAGELLLENQKRLADVIVKEMGKTLPESMGDIKSSADAAYFMAGEGRRMYGQTTFSALDKRWALTKRFPVGVCGLITAWNAPMAIITWKAFPALICGNTIVLKPSEDTPLTAHHFGEIMKEAGLPDGVVNIVYGYGPQTGEALVRSRGIDLISFTGSTKVGRMIAEECGRNLKKCSLEMGGKNGLIVMHDANLDAAAKAVAAGAFSTAGQRCASTSRVFVHVAVYDAFLGKLFEETKAMKVGLGSDSATKVCPIINTRQYESILAQIEAAKRGGARLLYGGRALTDGEFARGCFIEPTIFGDVAMDSKLAREEIFGPVLAVFRIASLEEAVEKINSADYGLTASVFTASMDLALEAIARIQAGCCYVNAPTFGSEPHMPFGGLKNSGNGTREPGTQALDVFSDWKTIYFDYSGVARNSQYKTT